MRQNATTGAPVRSEPKLGNACACRSAQKSRDGEHFSAADHTLPTSSVNTYLEHAMPFVKKRVQHCAEASHGPAGARHRSGEQYKRRRTATLR
jgi:hypothetical protein